MKNCPSCRRDLPISEFNKNRQNLDGLASYCRVCARQKQRDLRRYGPDRIDATGSFAFSAWLGLRARCSLSTSGQWHNYGARGIKVCDRWRSSFANFLQDMGPRPTRQHQLDRINNDGDYEPGNCRWTDPYTQQNNRRVSRYVEINGERRTLAQWARHIGVGRDVIRYRVMHGWTGTDLLLSPGAARGEGNDAARGKG